MSGRRLADDTGGMDDHDFQRLLEEPHWVGLLQEYAERVEQVVHDREAEESGPRWAPRLETFQELPPEDLSLAHGELIALGWLTFQLGDRNNGLAYRLTPEGRQVLQRLEKHHEIDARNANREELATAHFDTQATVDDEQTIAASAEQSTVAA